MQRIPLRGLRKVEISLIRTQKEGRSNNFESPKDLSAIFKLLIAISKNFSISDFKALFRERSSLHKCILENSLHEVNFLWHTIMLNRENLRRQTKYLLIKFDLLLTN